MSAKLRRSFSGEFVARDRGNDSWHLARRTPHEVGVFLRHAERGAQRSFGTGRLTDLGIEWHAGKVLLTFMSEERVASVEAASVIVHEPLPRLYETLPLVDVDAGARRFWRRVFWLVRIPGGRYLLKVFARPKRP